MAMRSSGEVILPRLSLSVDATAEMKRNVSCCELMRDMRSFRYFGMAWVSGAGGAGRGDRFIELCLGATAEHEEKRSLFVIL